MPPTATSKERAELNILIVSGQWTTEPRRGGVQSNVCTLVAALAKYHPVTVLVPMWRKKKLEREELGAVSVYRRRLRSAEGRGFTAAKSLLAWLIDLPSTLRDLRRIFREQQIEVIHLHQLQANHATFAVARAVGGPPYVATFHGRDVRDYRHRTWIERLAIRQIVRRASEFTAVSEELAALAEREIPGVKNVRIIRNGIETGDMTTAAALPDRTPVKYFLAVGRLYPLHEYPLKGQDLLIRAWSRLSLTHPYLHLLLAGADEERRGYEALANAWGVSRQVHILGSLPRPQLLALIAASTGVVTASRSEGGGPTMTILETGLFARPLIASNIPAHAECLQSGVDCLLVPPEDSESIAKAVELLLDDPSLAARLGQVLQKKVLALSSAELMCERYASIAYAPALERKFPHRF